MQKRDDKSDAFVFELLRDAATQLERQNVLRDLAEVARLAGENNLNQELQRKHTLHFPLGIALRS